MLCTRLAIMVNGQFKCLGSIQHLKNKYVKLLYIIVGMGSLSVDVHMILYLYVSQYWDFWSHLLFLCLSESLPTLYVGMARTHAYPEVLSLLKYPTMLLELCSSSQYVCSS